MFSEPEIYDMIVIGGQEAKYTQKTSIIIEFANYLGGHMFKAINSVQMWEMFLVVFLKVKHFQFLNNIQSSSVATGMGNIFGNKGGL